MYNTILHFIENDIKEIERVVESLLRSEKDTDDLATTIQEKVVNLGRNLQAEIYEKLDEEIRNSIIRKKKWTIEQRNEEKEILDIMGMVQFCRTGYMNKKTGEYVYLLDKVLGFEGHQRITLGAAAKALEETIMTSYAKGGKAASITDGISKQAVKQLVHETKIDFPINVPSEKKRAKFLHIVADEDHVAAQFVTKKGDLPRDINGRKINTIMPKIICLYEDIINEAGENSKHPRYKLIGKRYFSEVHKGSEANENFWQEVEDYINTVYDAEYLERIYISGDGASWIKAGCNVLDKSKFVLDKFHIMKYINTSVAHLMDSADDTKSEIWEAINTADKTELKEIYKRIMEVTESQNKYDEVKGALNYLINNWKGIKIRVEDSGGCWGCCAEGQVSHILSARLSSRPMGWSVTGCDQIAKLRANKWNGGKVIDILKYQKKKQIKDDYRQEQEELIKELRKRQSGWDYEEQIKGSIPGLEQHSMKWMKALINQALDA